MTKVKLDENFVAEKIKEIIENLGISATATVSREDDVFLVDIASDDSALLIGKYGSNLESLQFILAVLIKTQSGQDNFEIYVDVNNWRRNREEKLRQMATAIADEVAATGREKPLYNLKSSERRVIHTFLTDHRQVTSVSEGEGPERHLIIKPKSAKA